MNNKIYTLSLGDFLRILSVKNFESDYTCILFPDSLDEKQKKNKNKNLGYSLHGIPMANCGICDIRWNRNYDFHHSAEFHDFNNLEEMASSSDAAEG